MHLLAPGAGRRRLRLAVAGLLAVAAPLATVTASTAQESTTRAASVAPADALFDGDVVEVSWQGFGAGEGVIVSQCAASPASLDDCDQPVGRVEDVEYVVVGSSDTGGSGSMLFRVRSGASIPTLDCSPTSPCSIALRSVNDEPASFATSAVILPLQFASTPTSCPAPEDDPLVGDGAAMVDRAMVTWIAELCGPPSSLALDWTRLTSPLGREHFLQGLVDYAVTDTPVTEAEWDRELAARPYAYAPVAAGGLAIVYSIRDRVTGERIDDLRLTPALAARIFTYQRQFITEDQEFLALNPGHAFPLRLEPALRAERNADTLLLTSWFHAFDGARADFQRLPEFAGVGPTESFPPLPDRSNLSLVTGPDSLAKGILVHKNAKLGTIGNYTGEGLIAVVDTAFAAAYNLPVAALQNANGEFVQPTPAALGAASAAMRTNPDGVTRSFDFRAKVGGAYPLPKVSYMAVPTAGIEPGKATTLRALLEHIAGPGQAEGNLPRGYVPLSADLRAATLAARDAVPTDGRAAPPPRTAKPSLPAPAPAPVLSVATPLVPTITSFAVAPLPALPIPELALPVPAPAPVSAIRPLRTPARPGLATSRIRLPGDDDPTTVLLPLVLVGAALALLAGPTVPRIARARKRSA